MRGLDKAVCLQAAAIDTESGLPFIRLLTIRCTKKYFKYQPGEILKAIVSMQIFTENNGCALSETSLCSLAFLDSPVSPFRLLSQQYQLSLLSLLVRAQCQA